MWWARTRCSPGRPGRPPPRAGPRGTGSSWPQPVVAPCGPRAGWSWARSPCPAHPSASTPWCWPAARVPTPPAATRRSWPGSPPTAPRCRRVATVCSGAFLGAAAGLLAGRRVTTHWARARELARGVPGAHRRPRPDLRPRRKVLVERRRHGRHRPLPRPGARGPRGGRRADGGPLARHVPAPAGRPDPVRVAGLGPARRAHHRPGGADARRDRPGGRSPRAGPWRPPPP